MDKDEELNKGTYCLIIYVNKDSRIKIGAKGLMEFKSGYYVYVGSALNNLSKRIERHISKDKKKHWHMDYFSMNKNVEIKQVIYIQSLKKIECDVSMIIDKNSIDKIDTFGCSDCNCDSHLYYFDSYDDAVETSIDAFEKINEKVEKWY